MPRVTGAGSRSRSKVSKSNKEGNDSKHDEIYFMKGRRVYEYEISMIEKSGAFDTYVYFDFAGATNGTPFFSLERHTIDNQPGMNWIRQEGMNAATR